MKSSLFVSRLRRPNHPVECDGKATHGVVAALVNVQIFHHVHRNDPIQDIAASRSRHAAKSNKI